MKKKRIISFRAWLNMNKLLRLTKIKVYFSLIISLVFLINAGCSSPNTTKPNIMWIFLEDASCNFSSYGETAIPTPNIEQLAKDGVKFENAFITAPVCSPSRSALVTGMHQNTIGAHNHRSQRIIGKGGENANYFTSFNLPKEIPIASKLFEKAGYYTTNENIEGKRGKEDYNFIHEDCYSGASWKDAPNETPFFSQIQLMGGKNRSHLADTDNFKLPPYYFDDEVMRNDWKEYLGSWLDADDSLKQIVKDLKTAGVYDNTMIFFLTDHGVSHLRGKQFLYDEGIKIPLIVKFPHNKNGGAVRKDLVSHIDLLASSLAIAGLPIPKSLQGKDLFAEDYEEQKYVFSSRDRCDETIDIIRSVRSDRYKYIRNFLCYRPHTQRNQYKDGKEISKHMRKLFNSGKLNELQSRIYQPTRAREELYDLENDPYEINNLAEDLNYITVLKSMKSILYEWMTEINDPGLLPEPILEELGNEYGDKYTAMKQPKYNDIQKRLIRIIEAGEYGDINYLLDRTNSEDPSERYWALTWIGINKTKSAKDKVILLCNDENPTVRIAANLARYRIDQNYNPIPLLAEGLNNKNLIVGMYAMSAIEQSGIRNYEVKKVAEKASKSKYEFTMRYGKYLENECKKNRNIKKCRNDEKNNSL